MKKIFIQFRNNRINEKVKKWLRDSNLFMQERNSLETIIYSPFVFYTTQAFKRQNNRVTKVINHQVR